MRLFGITIYFLICSTVFSFAGNEDRAGSAGAGELLINPFARSSGWGSANNAGVRGIDAFYLNPAGLAFVTKTDIMFANTNWLVGSGITINSLGFGQKVGESGVISSSVMVMSFGEIDVTTTDMPDGGIGTYSPQFMNIGLSYSKSFSNSISGGLTVKAISEKIANLGAFGIAFDAGIQYVTGPTDNIKFGISLKNVGPPMQFKGDGFSVSAILQSSGQALSLEQRSARFELPSALNIGLGYDFNFTENHRLTIEGTFTSNSFTRDQLKGGLEYGLTAPVGKFILRGGYVWENNLTDDAISTTAFSGPAAGLTLELPFGKKGSSISLDYSYKPTNPFNGTHSVGARINIQ